MTRLIARSFAAYLITLSPAMADGDFFMLTPNGDIMPGMFFDSPAPAPQTNQAPMTGLMPEDWPVSFMPDNYLKRWRQCAQRPYMDTHQTACIADISRIVCHLYVVTNRPVTQELNDCQNDSYAAAHPHQCVKAALDHFNALRGS